MRPATARLQPALPRSRPCERSRRSSSGSTPFMSHAPSAALSRRHALVRDAIARAGLDALVVTSLPNVLYLTNFTGSSGIVVVEAERLRFVTDFRYVSALAASRGAPHECPDLDVVVVDGSFDATLASVIASAAGRRVGFEAAHLTVARHQWPTSTLAASSRTRWSSCPLRGSSSARASARTTTRSRRCARRRGGSRRWRARWWPGFAAGARSARRRRPSTGSCARGRSEERRVGKECRSRWSPY